MRRYTLLILLVMCCLLAACVPVPPKPDLSPLPPATAVATKISATAVAATAVPTKMGATSVAATAVPTKVSVTATPTPDLAPNKGGLAGQILTTAGGGQKPLVDVVVRLARVYWNQDKSDGAYVLEGATSPAAFTRAEGAFLFYNVEPGD